MEDTENMDLKNLRKVKEDALTFLCRQEISKDVSISDISNIHLSLFRFAPTH